MPELNEVGGAREMASSNITQVARFSGAAASALLTALDAGDVRLGEVDASETERFDGALSVHEWIPMGSLSRRTQCRCCHCGVVRTYELSTTAGVSYSHYGEVIYAGPLETHQVPRCSPAKSPMPSAVGARSWDILSLL